MTECGDRAVGRCEEWMAGGAVEVWSNQGWFYVLRVGQTLIQLFGNIAPSAEDIPLQQASEDIALPNQ